MQRSLLWKLLQAVVRVSTTLLFDLRTYGRGNVPAAGGVLLVANHQSYLDPMLIAVHLRRPVSFMARSGLFSNPMFSWLIRNLHAFPVRQGQGDVGAVKEAIHRLREGYILNIYPEGSRTETGEIGPMEKGVALVIRRAGVPVVPVAIDGSFQAWPKGRILFRPHPIRVLYGPAMDLSRLSAEDILSRLDAALRGLLSQLQARRVGPPP
ncbi:MAG: lysophospholipid acyltransferase family protein [Tepidisphaeraceae bacterium]|jgi:1-acyl-sn-glycerol-3-phosphate acyltransferase